MRLKWKIKRKIIQIYRNRHGVLFQYVFFSLCIIGMILCGKLSFHFYIEFILTIYLSLICGTAVKSWYICCVKSKYFWFSVILPILCIIYLPIIVINDRLRSNDSKIQKLMWIIKAPLLFMNYPIFAGIFFNSINKFEIYGEKVEFWAIEEYIIDFIVFFKKIL